MVNRNEAPKGCVAVLDINLSCDGCCFHNGNCKNESEIGCCESEREDMETVIFKRAREIDYETSN